MELTLITSTQNPIVQALAALKSSSGRREQGLFLLEGGRLVGEALRLAGKVDTLLVQEDKQQAFQPMIDVATAQGATVLLLSERAMQKFSDTKTSPGIAATMATMLPKRPLGARILALDGVSDPGNLGTTLRSALAFGVSDVLLGPGCADAFSPKSLRAGMGAHFHLALRDVADLGEALAVLGGEGASIVGMDIAGEEQMPPRSERTVCVLGSEAHGLSEGVKTACTSLWRLPMDGRVDSLNAAVAAGIALYSLFSG